MVQFRNVSADDRQVVYGVIDGPTEVPVDGLVTVDDDAVSAYECQPSIWRRVDTPPAAPAAPTTVAKPVAATE